MAGGAAIFAPLVRPFAAALPLAGKPTPPPPPPAAGGASPGLSNSVLPSSSNRLLVAPFHDDLIGTAAGGVYLKQIGTAPNVETIISWERWSIYGITGTTINFQIRFKVNGDIEYHYGPTIGGSGTNGVARVQGSSATVWLEAVTAADSYAARTADSVVPTSNPIFEGLGIRYRALRP